MTFRTAFNPFVLIFALLLSACGGDSLLRALELEGDFSPALAFAPEGELQQHTDSLSATFASVEAHASR